MIKIDPHLHQALLQLCPECKRHLAYLMKQVVPCDPIEEEDYKEQRDALAIRVKDLEKKLKAVSIP